MAKYAVWGAPASCSSGSLEGSFALSGNNFGNILIGNGIISNLSSSTIVNLNEVQASGELGSCERLIIPAANFLWKGFDLGFLADQLETTTIPITMIGLGAQSSDRIQKPTINPGTARLIKLISERSPSIGVRGHYTAETLCSLGIMNTVPLGCPSFFSKGLSGFQQLCDVPFANSMLDDLSICINLSRRVARHSFFPLEMQAAESVILNLAISKRAPFVAQDEIEELVYSADHDNGPLEDAIAYFSSIDPIAVCNYFAEYTRYFVNVSEWSEFVSGYELVMGTRFHGCLIALLSGIPALLLVHDSRTLEMAALAGIPYVLANQIHSQHDLQSIIQSLDYSLFKSNMQLLNIRFNDFLAMHELDALY